MTKGVQTLMGDPKKAIIQLSLPMIAALSLNSLYNFVDRLWVSSLGENALAATGFFMPFFFLAMAVATGIGVGGGAVVSRRIGAKDKTGAESAALHTILFSVLAAVLFTVPLIFLSPFIFRLMGASNSLNDATSYGTIMFSGIIFLFFGNTANSLLRSEGNAKKAMGAMVVGTVLNIFLDPLFIYGFNMGVAGAAVATVISMAVSALLLLYWLFVEKKSYLAFDPRAFRFEKKTAKEIWVIGFPTILSQGSMSIMMFFIVMILNSIADDRAIAVFTAGWTIVAFAVLPVLGIATAVISVTAAAFGAKDYRKARTAFSFSFTIGLCIEIVIAAFTLLAAPVIALMFALSPETALLVDDITIFFRTIWLYFPVAAGGIISQSLFQGIRMPFKGLTVTLLRTVIFTLFFAWLFGIALGYGVRGVYAGMVAATISSSIIGVAWAWMSINSLMSKTGVKIEPITENE